MIDVTIPVGRNVTYKVRRNEKKVQEIMYRNTTNVEYGIYDYTSNNRNHQNSNESFKEKFGNHTKKKFNRVTTKTAVHGTSHTIRKVPQSET
jgi:hypothetical protein